MKFQTTLASLLNSSFSPKLDRVRTRRNKRELRQTLICNVWINTLNRCIIHTLLQYRGGGVTNIQKKSKKIFHFYKIINVRNVNKMKK